MPKTYNAPVHTGDNRKNPGTPIGKKAYYPSPAGERPERRVCGSFTQIRKDGFVRVRVDGKIVELEKIPKLNKKIKHNIEVVVDRLILKKDIKKRLADSVETALKYSKGTVLVNYESGEELYSELYACVHCGISFEEPAPRMFSFNSPYGACPKCGGLGNKMEIDPDLIIPDKSKPLISAIQAWKRGGRGIILYYRRQLRR